MFLHTCVLSYLWSPQCLPGSPQSQTDQSSWTAEKGHRTGSLSQLHGRWWEATQEIADRLLYWSQRPAPAGPEAGIRLQESVETTDREGLTALFISKIAFQKVQSTIEEVHQTAYTFI